MGLLGLSLNEELIKNIMFFSDLKSKLFSPNLFHSPYFLAILTIALFAVLFNVGLDIARKKPIWNDEFYSQLQSVSATSYKQMFAGKIQDGNNSPLFYSIQKALCQFTGYENLEAWKKGDWSFSDDYSRVLLRINPVFFMSLMMVMIFYYFAKFHSLFEGGLSIFLSLSSFMLWNFWAEARPYALWMFLTASQSLLFLYLVRCRRLKDENDKEECIYYKRGLISLCIVNLLMAFTVIFSVAQVFIVSLLLWFFVDKRWGRYIFIAVIPICIGLFYYYHAPKYDFHFNLKPDQLIRDCFSRDRFHNMFIYAFFLAVYGVQSLIGKKLILKDKKLFTGLPYFFVTVMMILSSFALLILLKLGDEGKGFEISSRYFVYLTPISIIATVIFSGSVIKSLKGCIWVQLPVLYGISWMVINRFHRLMPHMRIFMEGLF